MEHELNLIYEIYTENVGLGPNAGGNPANAPRRVTDLGNAVPLDGKTSIEFPSDEETSSFIQRYDGISYNYSGGWDFEDSESITKPKADGDLVFVEDVVRLLGEIENEINQSPKLAKALIIKAMNELS
jgi:hypothetical protein